MNFQGPKNKFQRVPTLKFIWPQLDCEGPHGPEARAVSMWTKWMYLSLVGDGYMFEPTYCLLLQCQRQMSLLWDWLPLITDNNYWQQGNVIWSGSLKCINRFRPITNINSSTDFHGEFPYQGFYSLRRRRLTGIGIPMINLRWSDDHLRFIMGIPILIRRGLLSE